MSRNDDLTHINHDGSATMVDVGDKSQTQRRAVATSAVQMDLATLKAILEGDAAKGDVISTARLAGIMGAKRTSDLIPLCHPLLLTKVDVTVTSDETLPGLRIEAEARVNGQTGVEMEALTAASVTALTIYDMAKAMDRAMEIGPTLLTHKSGGKSGTYDNP
jgi:cyclic pyranopterin phosphate synthase